MLALIDADTPIVAAALSAKEEPLWKATSRLDRMIDGIIEGSGCTEYRLYVSAGDNFRYDIDQSYKANRPDQPIEHRAECHAHLVEKWDAIETDGYEADDAVGCEQRTDGSTIICGIDKDLLMVPGKHYRWPIMRGGKVVREPEYIEVDAITGIRRLFTQAITGDTSDNIKGVKGAGIKKAEKLLGDVTDEHEMFEIVRQMYNDDLRYMNNLDLLWIWREYGITYSIRREMYVG